MYLEGGRNGLFAGLSGRLLLVRADCSSASRAGALLLLLGLVSDGPFSAAASTYNNMRLLYLGMYFLKRFFLWLYCSFSGERRREEFELRIALARCKHGSLASTSFCLYASGCAGLFSRLVYVCTYSISKVKSGVLFLKKKEPRLHTLSCGRAATPAALQATAPQKYGERVQQLYRRRVYQPHASG